MISKVFIVLDVRDGTESKYPSIVFLSIHSIGSMKPDIAINLSLANIPVTVCLKRYPLLS